MRRGGIPKQAAVLIALMERQTQDGGRTLVSRPRAEVARELGVSESTVRASIERLKACGVLALVEKGHNGRTSVYEVLPDSAATARDGP